jgi:hypothetical protein
VLVYFCKTLLDIYFCEIVKNINIKNPTMTKRERLSRRTSWRPFFIYVFFFDFKKINGRTKNFEKYTSAAVPHGVKSLPPWGTVAGEHFRRQGRVARR